MESVLVILRRVYLDITGNHCAAKLIEYFKHWREWKLKSHRTDWVYMPVRQIYEDLMEEHSINIIRRAIAKLIDLKILEQRHNPGNGQDRTWQYRLNLEVLQSELARLKDETPSVKSDQCSTQDQSTNIKSTEQVEAEKSFPQEQSSQLLDKYKEQLKLYGIYTKTWHNDAQVDNPKLKPTLAALAKIPRQRAERAIEAFLKWIRTAKNVENEYKALEAALWRGWG